MTCDVPGTSVTVLELSHDPLILSGYLMVRSVSVCLESTCSRLR